MSWQWLESRLTNETAMWFYLSWKRGTWGTFFWTQRMWVSWWRHQMETFSALLAICAENSPVPGEFTAQRPVTRSFDVFFDLRLNKRLSKQWWGWWFETLSHPLWCRRNGVAATRATNVQYHAVTYTLPKTCRFWTRYAWNVIGLNSATVDADYNSIVFGNV